MNTITICIDMVETFCSVIAELELKGVRFHVETTPLDFVITVTGA